MKLFGLFPIVLLISTVAMVKADMQEEIRKEANALLQEINLTDLASISRVCKKLEYSGYTDSRIYDELEKYLLDYYKDASSRPAVNSVSWAVQALGFSGEAKYQDTMKEVRLNGGHKKLRKYAKLAQGFTAKYSQWNPIISRPEKYEDALSLNENRYANMLRSDESSLHILAAKRIYFERITAPEIVALVRSRIANPAPGSNKKVTKWLMKSVANIAKLQSK